MIWKNERDEKPEGGAIVTVIRHHCKNEGYQSCELFTGEAEYSNKNEWRVNTCDYTGKGSWCLYPESSPEARRGFNDDTFEYWCFTSDMPELPIELQVNK